MASDRSRLLFTWQGLVDGQDIIKFREESYSVEHESKLPIRDIRFDARRPLRAEYFPVRLVKLSGRGKVDILRQGDAFNRYTLVVRVDDRHIGGAGFYKLAVYATHRPAEDRAVFSVFAEVDRDLGLDVAGFAVRRWSRSPGGEGGLKYAFPLGRPVDPAARYRLRVVRGKGTVRLEMPTADRKWFRILVSDPDPGPSGYILELLPE